MRIYVGCSLTQAPDTFKQDVETFKRRLKQLPDVEVFEFVGLVNGTSKDVYQTDLGNVERCNVFVAICDLPSIGLGMEIQHAGFFNKRTLCLYHEGVSVTRMLHGAKELGYLELGTYRVLSEDGVRVVEQYLARHMELAAQ